MSLVTENLAKKGVIAGGQPTGGSLVSQNLRARGLIGGNTQVPHKQGLVQNVVQGVANPFLRLGTNALNFGEGVGDLGAAALSEIVGDKASSQKFQQQASQAATKTRDYGYFGKNIAPVGGAPVTGNVGKDIGTGVKDIIGTGAEIGSYLAPVGVGGEAVGAAKVAKQGLLPVLKKAGEGAAFGTLGGAIGSAGAEAQKRDSTLGSIAGAGAVGGLAGGTLGGAIPLAGAAIGKTASEASRLLSKDQRVASTIAANERALRQLEVNNAPLRKLAAANKTKGVDPVKLLSGTDLLKGAVDETGTIRTTGEGGAVSQLQEFIKPQEDIVSRALAQEGKTVPLADLRQQMIDNINSSGIKGADKISALNAVENEIKGLQLEAGPEGNIPLSAVHDAKRYKYANINYLNPSSKNTDKIIARTLKDIVEKNTTSADIKALNNELGAHYSVLSLLEKLDGKKVQGGKLGRYFAKTIGGIAGSHFGPLGSIAGSEIAGKIQGALLKSNFAGETGKVLERSPLMEKTLTRLSEAERQAKLPKLALPAPSEANRPAIALHGPTQYEPQAKIIGKGLLSGPMFERAQGLTSVDRKVESAAFDKIKHQEAALLKQYDLTNGKIINTDEFRKLFSDVGYVGHNAAAVQEPSSYLSKKAFINNLGNPGEFATLYAGGSGTGKSSAIRDIASIQEMLDNSAVVLDGNLSSYSSAKKRISEAVKAGKSVPIVYVYRSPEESFEMGVVKRMLSNPDEGGRLVPTKVVAENHIGSFDTVSRLSKDGETVFAIDNSLGRGNARLVPFSELQKKIRYPSVAELTKKLNLKAKELYESGQITESQYKAYIK